MANPELLEEPEDDLFTPQLPPPHLPGTRVRFLERHTGAERTGAVVDYDLDGDVEILPDDSDEREFPLCSSIKTVDGHPFSNPKFAEKFRQIRLAWGEDALEPKYGFVQYQDWLGPQLSRYERYERFLRRHPELRLMPGAAMIAVQVWVAIIVGYALVDWLLADTIRAVYDQLR